MGSISFCGQVQRMIGLINKNISTLKIIFLFATFVGICMIVYVGYENYGINLGWIIGQEKEEGFYKNWSNSSKLNAESLIVNPHPFKYIINQEHVCRTSGNISFSGITKDPKQNYTRDELESTQQLFAIIYIHSHPENFNRRMLIRSTWGNCSSTKYTCRLIFFVGLPGKKGVEEAIRVEADTYKDVVQEDFLDHYHNLTYKAIGAMRWISEFCFKTRFIVKADDDVFVNTIQLFKLLENKYNGPMRRKLFCYVWTKAPVLRSGRWKVTEEELPRSYYPKYCSGSAFILSADLASEFINISKYVPFVWVDDAYLTGLLSEALGDVTFEYLNSLYTFNERKYYDSLLFVHTSKADVIRELWRKAVEADSSKR